MELQQLHTDSTKVCIGFAESRIGGRTENQDTYGALDTKRGFIVTVCDGMGGGPGGKTASTIAVKEILAGIAEASDDEETMNVVIKAVRRANMAIIEAATETPSLRGMGSTATVLLISPQAAIAAHVGDSRIYQLRGRKKVFRTFDHSMVFELVKQKVISEEQARLSANSNVITRALGVTPDVQVDVAILPYEKGDRFVLCSDGIHGTMNEPDLLKLFSSKKQVLGVMVDDIATQVDNIGRTDGGGHDNLTLAIVETTIKSKLRPQMTKQIKLLLLSLVLLCACSITLNVWLIAGYKKNTASDRGTVATNTVTATIQKTDTITRKAETTGDKTNTTANKLQKVDSVGKK